MSHSLKKKSFKFGFVADPIESFHKEAETTFFIMNEVSKRGYENWIMEMQDLFILDSQLKAKAKKIKVGKVKNKFDYKVLEEKVIDLKDCDCIFLRKDPPVDLDFINHLTLLETLEVERLTDKKVTDQALRRKPLLINSPQGVKKANEKIYPLRFSEVSPPSVVSSSLDILLSFLKKYPKAVVKPLNSSGGKGVLIVSKDDPNHLSILELATKDFKEFVILQKYIPEAAKGDKRILLLNGEPLGSFLRVPSKTDFRGNMHSGASWVSSQITAKESQMIKNMKSQFLSDGLYFVGIDLIGSFITEINSTSPMGIREINELNKSCCEKVILDWVESLLSN